MVKYQKTTFLGFAVILVLFGAVLGLPSYGEGMDWLEWRGPNRAGISPETGWLSNFPEGGTESALEDLGWIGMLLGLGERQQGFYDGKPKECGYGLLS